MVKNYILRQCDVVALHDYAVPEHGGKIFFFVDKTEEGKTSILAKDGKKYRFPVDSINLIRNHEGWWTVTATYCEMKDIEQYGDVSYDMEPICRSVSVVLDCLLIDA
ncbi:MAG: hypothetical protein IJ629_03295 [Clostridia bacterium]|nr:hypothetical protein [Clostridia bacterium]